VPPHSGGWRFLTGPAPRIRALAGALGFRYAYDPASGQYAHAAALFVITADGRIAKYLYGVSFDGVELAAALDQARLNRVGGPVDRFLMRCFHYVPALREHGPAVAWLLRLTGLAVVAGAGGVLAALWRRDAARIRISGKARRP
jgi:protein SCO1/2